MKRPVHKKTDYSRITREIFIGTNFCCRAHFDKRLLAQGITTDISLEDQSIDTPFGARAYLWLPVKDHEPPAPYQLALGVAVLGQAVAKKAKVYVHCKNGHGRAPTLVAAYGVSQGLSVKEAVGRIARERPEIHLTARQLKALEQYKRSLKRQV